MNSIARIKWGTTIVLLLLLCDISTAQEKPVPTYGSDVASADGIVQAFFSSLSGPAGKREWSRFRALFHANSRIHAVQYDQQGQAQVLSGDVDNYIEKSKPFFQKHGFFQKEVKRNGNSYGQMVQLFSAYVSTYHFPEKDTVTHEYGMIGFQLVQNDNRWWIMDVFWNAEGPDALLPLSHIPKPEQLILPKTYRKTFLGEVHYPDVNKIFHKDSLDWVPNYPGGSLDMLAYFQEKIAASTSLPKSEKTANLSFVVELDGRITNVVVKGSKDDDLKAFLQEAALRMPTWEPGIKDECSVRVQYDFDLPLKAVEK